MSQLYDVDEDEHEDRGESAPAMVSPFFFFPPRLAGLPERPFQNGPYGPIIDGRGGFNPFFFKKVVSVPQDDTVLSEQTDSRSLRGHDLFYPPEQGAGEPREGMPGDETFGGNLLDPIAFERSVWQSLQEMYNGPVVTNYGTVSFILKHGMRVDITTDYAVRVVNFTMHCTAAINGLGDRSCVCHPCGRAIQEGMDVDMAYGIRLAKISSRGVTFTALNHGLVYLVDASGTKSTTERFQNLGYDIPMSVFYSHSEQGMDVFEDCFDLINRVRQRTTENGDEVWVVNGVRIKQTAWGDVQVSRDSGRRVIWSSPTAGTISVTTPVVKMAVTCDPSRYFFVRAGQKRISGTWDGFAVRNGSQRAGFDHRGRLILP